MYDWRRLTLAAGLAGLLVAYWIAWHAPSVGTFHDDGVYLVTAKALAEGKGYRIISLPQEIAQTKYPVLFPLVMAGMWKLNPQFPANLLWLKLAPLCFTILWLSLTYMLLREEGVSAWMATWICLLTAASTWVVYLATMILSEAPFAALTTASLLCFRRGERRGSAGYFVASAIFAALAFHTRTVGIALLAAAPLYLAFKRQWRQAFTFALLAGLLAVPWVWWAHSHTPAAGAVDAYYSGENYQGWNIIANFEAKQKFVILGYNLAVVLFAPGLLLGIPVTGLLVLPMLAAGLTVYAGVIRHRATVFAFLLLLYGAIVCAWAWIPSRFVVPFLPLLVWFGIDALRNHTRARVCAMTLLTLASAASLAVGIEKTIRLGHPPLPTPVSEEDRWDRLEALLAGIRTQTPPGAVLAGNLDPLYYLYTGRKSVRGFTADPYGLIYEKPDPDDSARHPLGDPDALLRRIRASGATYWVHSPNSAFLEGRYLSRMLREIIRRDPSPLERMAGSDPTHSLYRLRTLPPAAEPQIGHGTVAQVK